MCPPECGISIDGWLGPLNPFFFSRHGVPNPVVCLAPVLHSRILKYHETHELLRGLFEAKGPGGSGLRPREQRFWAPDCGPVIHFRVRQMHGYIRFIVSEINFDVQRTALSYNVGLFRLFCT